MGNGKSNLLLQVEKIIWGALFEIAQASRNPELILIELVNSRIPWEALSSPSLPDSERCWFDLSGLTCSEDDMDVCLDRGTIEIAPIRESGVLEDCSDAAPKSNFVRSDAVHTSVVSGSIDESQDSMGQGVGIHDHPMDTEQDCYTGSPKASDHARFDEDAEGEDDPLHANDHVNHNDQCLQTGADTLLCPVENDVDPIQAVPPRSSGRLKQKTDSSVSSQRTLPSDLPQRPPKKRKRNDAPKRNDPSEDSEDSEQTQSRSHSPELKPTKRAPSQRLRSAGSKPSFPIDVDALDTLKQRIPLALEFPLALEQQVCVCLRDDFWTIAMILFVI